MPFAATHRELHQTQRRQHVPFARPVSLQTRLLGEPGRVLAEPHVPGERDMGPGDPDVQR